MRNQNFHGCTQASLAFPMGCNKLYWVIYKQNSWFWTIVNTMSSTPKEDPAIVTPVCYFALPFLRVARYKFKKRKKFFWRVSRHFCATSTIDNFLLYGTDPPLVYPWSFIITQHLCRLWMWLLLHPHLLKIEWNYLERVLVFHWVLLCTNHLLHSGATERIQDNCGSSVKWFRHSISSI